MSRDWLLYLDDIIASAEKITEFVKTRTLETFTADHMCFDAVLFNLQVIGEAYKKLPAEIVKEFPAKVGGGPARLRDLIAHRYFSLDPDIVWEVANSHVPQLLVHARLVLAKHDKG